MIKNAKNNKNDFLLVAVLVIVIPIGFFSYWYFTNRDLFNASAPNQSVANISKNERVKDIDADKAAILNAISGLNKCGDWPLATTTLSPNRGNPFAPQSVSDAEVPSAEAINTLTEPQLVPLVANCQPLNSVVPVISPDQSIPAISQ
ncbi:MAG: hypothetical protein WC516_00410 [Patescibacteria group bacterium]